MAEIQCAAMANKKDLSRALSLDISCQLPRPQQWVLLIPSLHSTAQSQVNSICANECAHQAERGAKGQLWQGCRIKYFTFQAKVKAKKRKPKESWQTKTIIKIKSVLMLPFFYKKK